MGRGANTYGQAAAVLGVGRGVPREAFPERGRQSENARLREAVADLAQRAPRAPNRLEALQELCVAGIDRRLGPDCDIEIPIEGAYGEDCWDVASLYVDEPRLLISAKSLGSSRHNNVGNRLKEMLGEAINVREHHPDAVLGYVCVITSDSPARLDRRSGGGPGLSRHSDRSIATGIGARCRALESQLAHHYDAGCVIRADLSTGTLGTFRAPGLASFGHFLDELVAVWGQRCAARGIPTQIAGDGARR